MRVGSKTAGLLFGTLFFAWACIQAGSGQARQKGDEETIQAAVETYGFYETSGPNGEYDSEREHVVFRGCTMTVHVVAVGADEPPYKRETIEFDVVIGLKKMDPKAVARPTDLNGNALPGGRQWLILKTADGQEWIKMKRGKTMMSASSVWPLPGGANHEENQKVADAFGRITTACRRGM